MRIIRILFIPELNGKVTEFSQDAVKLRSDFSAKNERSLFEKFCHFGDVLFNVLCKLLIRKVIFVVIFVEDDKLVDFRDDFLELLAVGIQLMYCIEHFGMFGIDCIELFPALFIKHQPIGLINAI